MSDGKVETQELIDGLKKVDGILHRKYWRGVKFKEKPATFMLLGHLKRAQKKNPEGGARVSELAADIGMTSSAITQAVTLLEERGLVGRKMDPEDRRAVLVYLTEEGMGHIDSMMSILDDILGGLVEHLGSERSRLFLDILNEVAQYLESQGLEEVQRGDPA